MDGLEIKEICLVADTYLQQLKELDEEISTGIEQINGTAATAEEALLARFATMQVQLNDLLTKRKNALLKKIISSKAEAITPLQVCSDAMREKMVSIEKFLKLGETINEKCTEENRQILDEFIIQSEELEKFPEVSTTKRVPYINFEVDDCSVAALEEMISKFGEITMLGPIQITEMTEKPGAILVEWRVADNEDQVVDIQEYCLQKAPGEFVADPSKFETCYVGEDTHFLSKDIVVDEYYSYRVTCKFEGSTRLSRWSIPMSYKTTIKSYNWKENGHYSMNDEFRIARPLVDGSPILISEGRQFRVGYTIEFTILKMDRCVAYIGLSTAETKTLSNMKDPNGTFIVDSKGNIKVDGVTKSTFLPEFKRDCKICFSCECLKDERVVIHIDLEDKRVTYEWGVRLNESFFFAAELPTTRWKIMVE